MRDRLALVTIVVCCFASGIGRAVRLWHVCRKLTGKLLLDMRVVVSGRMGRGHQRAIGTRIVELRRELRQVRRCHIRCTRNRRIIRIARPGSARIAPPIIVIIVTVVMVIIFFTVSARSRAFTLSAR